MEMQFPLQVSGTDGESAGFWTAHTGMMPTATDQVSLGKMFFSPRPCHSEKGPAHNLKTWYTWSLNTEATSNPLKIHMQLLIPQILIYL